MDGLAASLVYRERAMDALQLFYVAMLIPPAIVLLTAALPATARRQQPRLDMDGFLLLATAPHSVGQIFIVQRLLFRIDFRWWPLFWFVYFSIALALSVAFAFRRRNARGWRRQCELAFSVVYFGAHWLLSGYAVFVGAPPL